MSNTRRHFATRAQTFNMGEMLALVIEFTPRRIESGLAGQPLANIPQHQYRATVFARRTTQGDMHKITAAGRQFSAFFTQTNTSLAQQRQCLIQATIVGKKI